MTTQASFKSDYDVGDELISREARRRLVLLDEAKLVVGAAIIWLDIPVKIEFRREVKHIGSDVFPLLFPPAAI